MAKLVTDAVLKKNIEDILTELANRTYEFEEYNTDEIDDMFDATPEEISYYESLIQDASVSSNRLWSSKKISEEIAQCILNSNAYAEGLIADISSIELVYVTTLPTSNIKTNTIYILKSTNDNPDTLNLYDGTNWSVIGDFGIKLSDYYNKSEVDSKLDDKANKSEVLSVDSVQTTTGSETNDTVYSSKLTKDELDKKVNITDIATTISSTPSDDKVASEKAVSDVVSDIVPFKFGIDENGNYGYYKAGADTVTPFKSIVEPEDTGKIYGNRGRIKLMKMGNHRYFDSVDGEFIDVGLGNIVLDEEDRPLSNITLKCLFTNNGRDWINGTLVMDTNGKLNSSVGNTYYFLFTNCRWIAKS